MNDVADITNWTTAPVKYGKFLESRKKNKNNEKIKTLKIDKISPLHTYALIQAKLKIDPNGFYTSMIEGHPMDNMFWWDFIIESEIGFINILRNSSNLEAQYLISDEKFDVQDFLIKNAKKYKKDIEAKIGEYEEHKTFINHYQSYKKCSEYLWDEIKGLDLTPPPFKQVQNSGERDMEDFEKKIHTFTTNCIKFHALGKSLVLNSAFAAESFINLYIRVTAPEEIHIQKGLLKMHLNSNFETKLKNMQMISILELEPINFQGSVIQRTLDLMTLRNKYVHADESSPHNNLGSVFFDDMYSLLDSKSGNPVAERMKNIFLQPDFKTVENAYKTSLEFVDYIMSLIHPDVKTGIERIIQENPIGFNTKTHKYSAVYKSDIQFFMMDTGDN